MEKISYDEFLDRWNNLDLPDAALRPYVLVSPGESAFSVELRPNPETVTGIPKLESAMTFLNDRSRRQRQRDFERALARGDPRPVLVSEGDSWFQFPLLLDDVIDHLGTDYLIWSLGAAGDTVENMIDSDAAEYMQGLDAQAGRVQAFLLSAAGNDVIGARDGVPVLLSLLHNGSRADLPEKLVNQAELGRVTEKLKASYRKVVATIRADPRFTELPILIHGYDYAFPFPFGNDTRRPIWVFNNQDKWLGSAFQAKGITGQDLRRDIIRVLIDALHEALAEVADEDPNVHLVDLRGTLTKRSDWADEIHGTGEGFARVAAKFAAVLRAVLPVAPPLGTPALPEPASPATRGEETLLAPEPSLARHRYRLPEVPAKAMGIPDPERFGLGFTDPARLEAIVEEDDSVPFCFLSRGSEIGRAVARISTRGTTWDGKSGRWRGTGFLVGPNILLTNAHVLNSPEVAGAAKVEFGYEECVGGEVLPTVNYRLDPNRLFVSSGPEDLDYTFVWIEGDAAERFGHIQLWRGSFIAVDRHPAHVIHHPDGKPKRASLRRNDIVTSLGAREVLVHYTSDTMHGSSGAPVLRDDWRLFALHHAFEEADAELRAKLSRNGFDVNYVNEGIKISAIAIDLDMRARSGPNQQSAAEVLRHMGGSDSRTGFFGTLGREATGESAFERVVDTYRGGEQDVDVAFWNVAWFSRDVRQKAQGVARVIADLNLDIWVLEDASSEAAQALVAELKRGFQMQFELAVSETDTPDSQHNTAVIWNRMTVQGRRLDWPAEAERILRAGSGPDARSETCVFTRHPGLFGFSSTLSGTGERFDFLLVPLHLRALTEGAKRRRMATDALAQALMLALAQHGAHDILIGGDTNAGIGAGQMQALRDAGISVHGAADARDGAFTYLRWPQQSHVDSIFASPGMTQAVGSEDFILITADRTFPQFLTQVSDHRPVMVRLSLGECPGGPAPHLAPPVATPEISPGASDESLLQAFAERFRTDPGGTLRALADIWGQQES
ncbi:trypsin-like peptidase domain-containing protein [Salipiger mangrovisoli]|uniref:Trypsin-like peptidase domain-containing protein n=1 Tax=Salipiger mangrovisoli TaxID=2865933 RepID=A0ABR9X032_9RHOB|nr:trypsin-like peptidase domain-containing protein [Salipiger mangrovisoli]MBE9636845.1 trypsin-like peptidase domain-containing protein [Salipiger mangrovisoli]